MKTFIFFILLSFIPSFFFAQEIMLLKSSGKVVIGDTSQITTPGNYNLYVQHGILTERVKVSLKSTTEWSDDAFDKTPSLDDVALSISENKHLVGIPSASQLVQNGYELKEMDASLLKQIEWLWQHVIRMEEENKLLKKELELIKTGLSKEK
ncbi:MAG: hypothetical protein IPM42_09550 [Saprospiraceae bacterium]|jgi:trimeric autotransporter adhesin|nr:hypothetical protein [Saprospiraceae bacterium]